MEETLFGRPVVGRALIPAVIAFSIASSLTSQTRFAEPSQRGYLDRSSFRQTWTALADLDGDGDVDGFVGGRLFRNNAVGTTLLVDVTEQSMPTSFATSNISTAQLADFDGDGDLDLLTIGFEEVLYFNDGNGGFTDVTATHWASDDPASQPSALDVGDVDGDGDLDVYITQIGGSFSGFQDDLLLNDGTGAFTRTNTSRLPARTDFTSEVCLGDIDGDGDLDAFISRAAGDDSFLINDGTGTFSTSTLAMPTDTGFRARAAFGDFDGDGDLDLLRNGTTPGFNATERLWLNDGVGNFVDRTPTHIQGSTLSINRDSVAIEDLDSDGDLDAITAVVWLNDGSGVMTLLPDSSDVRSAQTGDLDGDGDPDMANFNGVFANDGTGRPMNRTEDQWFRAWSLDRVDLNGDGNEDVVIEATGIVVREALLRERGFVAFDANGDGLTDLLEPVADTARLFFGNGGSEFRWARSVQIPTGGRGVRHATPGDVDGDGDTDVVLGGEAFFSFFGPGCIWGVQTVLLRNDGQGNFAVDSAAMPSDNSHSTSCLDLGDVDADGDLDLILATGAWPNPCNGTGHNRLYINDGAGNFTDRSQSQLPNLAANESWWIEFGDVDNDGDLDAAVGGALSDQLYINDGTGHFTEAGSTWTPVRLGFSGFVDLDEDGDLDVVGAQGAALNDGNGGFVDITASVLTRPALTGDDPIVRLGDIDADGDIDIVRGANLQTRRALLNRQRDLRAVELARVGSRYRLRIESMPGYAPTPALAIPLVGFASADWATPFGRLGIDPRRAVTLPSVQLPIGTGSADVDLQIPTDPSLVDLEIFFQALIVGITPNPTTPALTNLWADQIIG